MKGKFLGLLAVVLLAGPMAANAAYMYSFSSNVDSDSFLLTTTTLITSQSFAPAAFDQLTSSHGAISRVDFANLDQTFFQIAFVGAAGSHLYGFGDGPAMSPGTYSYCPTATGCQFSLTIRETSVPEPGSLALLGLGLAGLGLARRRKAN